MNSLLNKTGWLLFLNRLSILNHQNLHMKLITTLLLCILGSSSIAQKISTHNIYFDYNRSEISSQQLTSLQQFLSELKGKTIGQVIIEGHTDEDGSKKYNDKLAADRAATVEQIVKKNLGADVIIRVSSFGKEKLFTTDPAKQDLNRRVELSISFTETIPPTQDTQLTPFFKDVELQKFSVNLDDTVIVTGKDGTIIKISPGSLQTKQGLLAKGNAEIQLKEYYNPADILLSGLNTISNQGLLQTGGMFYVLVIKDRDTISSRSLKPILIRMPVINPDDNNKPMNVYVREHNEARDIHSDTTTSLSWQNTDSVFSKTVDYWDFPPRSGKMLGWRLDAFNYKDWRNGYRYEDKSAPNGWNLFKRKWKKEEVKKYTTSIQKTDSVTLSFNVKLRYRNYGVKKHQLRDFDTSFIVKYRRQEYVGFTYTLNWINCDRFLNYPNVTDYYVATPGFNGANVMVYFKSQQAYMQAMNKDNNTYSISRIPPGQDVVVIAFGKRDDVYYLGKKNFTTSAKSKDQLDLQVVSKEDFHKTIKSL